MSTSNNYITQEAADARYQAVSSIGTDTPQTIDPDDAASAGTSPAASRGDHQHAITAGTPASIGLAGTNAESAGTGFARDLHVHAYNPPACRVTHNADQPVLNATLTPLAFNTEQFDTNSMHDTVTNNSRITFNTAGIYTITGSVRWAVGTTGYRYLDIMLNGTTVIATERRNAAVADQTAGVITTLYKFAVGDYVTLRGYQQTGGTVNVEASGTETPVFSAVWVGVG